MRALRAARLFDGTGIVAEPVVVVDEARGTIASVGEDVPGAEELGDVTLLPGLIDTHQHLCFDQQGTLEEQVTGVTDEALLERARGNAQKALRAGITTIRDLGDRGFVTLALRDDPSLPTILASGPPITLEGGHCWFLGGCCTGRDELVAAVRARAALGCDVVKIMVTGGGLTPTFPMWESQFSPDEVALVVDHSHALGLPVAAHCHGVEGIHSAVDAGVDTIEHCTFFTDSGGSVIDEALIDRIVAAGIAVSATLGADPAFTPPPFVTANFDTIVGGLRTLHQRGGRIVVGTDAGIGPAKPHDVLPLAVDHLRVVGMSPAEMLTTMTTTAADVVGLRDRKGRLAPGHDADLLAVRGDPTVDPAVLRDVVGVWRGGRRAS